jgi:hypothetical protein
LTGSQPRIPARGEGDEDVGGREIERDRSSRAEQERAVIAALHLRNEALKVHVHIVGKVSTRVILDGVEAELGLIPLGSSHLPNVSHGCHVLVLKSHRYRTEDDDVW